MKKLIGVFAVFLLLLLYPVSFVFAQEQSIVVTPDEVIEQNPYFAAGDNVTISGTIVGDAYVAGGAVTIDGTIEGDLIVAGGTVRITGEVTNDIRGASGQLTINGVVGGNITYGTGTLDISEDSSIGGYILAAGGNTYIAGPVTGDAWLAGGNINLRSEVGGNLMATTENLELSPGASVAGNLTYWSENDANIHEGATVSGEITMNELESKDIQLPSDMRHQARQGFAGMRYAGAIFGALSAFIIGLILLKIYPNYSKEVADTISESPWKSLGIGFAGVFLLPIAFIILLATVVGIPLALILLAGYGIYIYLAKIFVMYWAGLKISPKSKGIVQLLIGVAVFYLIRLLLPIGGGFVSLFATLFGFGALLISMRSVYKEAVKKKVI